MRLTVAGKTKDLEDGITVAKLIELENVETPEYVTVTVNDEFVESGDFGNTVLKDGDTVDVSKMTEDQIAKLDDKTDKCWYWCISDGTDKEEGYDWSTEQEVAQDLYDAYIMYKKEGTTVKCVYSLSDKKDPDSCEAQNED